MKFEILVFNIIILLFVNRSLFSQYVPELLYPHSSQIISETTINFIWNKDVHQNLNYQFQLSLNSNFQGNLSDQNTSSNSLLVNGLNNFGQIHYWRVRSSSGSSVSNWSEVDSFLLFKPTLISGLSVWLDPNTGVLLNGSNVQALYDNTSNSNNATQFTTNQQPLYISNDSLINNKAIFRYDGINDFLEIADNPSIDFTNQLSLFVLVRPTIIATNKTILAKWDYQTQGSWVFQTEFATANQLMFAPCFSITDPGNQKTFTTNANMQLLKPAFLSLTYNGANANSSKIRIFKNKLQLLTTTDNPLTSSLPNSTATLKIGKFGGILTRYYQGDIGEILIYNSELSQSNRQMVEDYLRFKYCPPVSLGPDTLTNPNLICTNIQLKTNCKYQSYQWSNGSTSSSINVTSPGVYFVTVTDFMGNVSSDTIEVFSPAIPTPPNNKICVNESAIWNANMGSSFTYLWNNSQTAPSISIATPGDYFVRVTDSLGCSKNSDTVQFEIDYYSQTTTLGNDTSLCSGNSIALQSNVNETVEFYWQDNLLNNQSSNFQIDSSGYYWLNSVNTFGCISNDTVYVDINGIAPSISINYPLQICQFDTINLEDLSSVPLPYSISSTKWIINSIDTLNGTSSQYLPTNDGNLAAQIIVNSAQCESALSFNITVHPKPILSFTTQNYCPYEAVQFSSNNSQLSSLSSHLWQFGDNSSSSLSAPTHVFGTTGTYNVSLQAQDINGCRDTVTQAVYIQPEPVAAFSFNNTCEETEVNFVNNSNIADTFNITTNTWTYGDGTQAINPSFQKIFADADTFDVQLIVTANNGCQDTSMQSIIIYPRPTLGWQVGPACKNTWTTFENLSSVSVGNIAQTDWLVNLQYPLEGASSAYQFVTNGVQYLNLTSTTDNGCQRDTLIIVNVQPEINAAYTVSPQTIVAGVPTTFTSTSTGATQYTWDLGDNNPIQTSNSDPVEIPGFDPTLVGDSIQTSLIIENTIGCRDTATQYIKVYEPRIDLVITQLFVQNLNGFYKVGVELRNQGFVEITKTDLLLKMYGSMPIMETENESLAPGESRIYLFNASPSAFISTQDNETNYLCVEANSYNDYQLIETELSNNVACLNTEGENFVLLPIYPNPTNDDISYSFILSEEATLNTSLTDETGRIVMEQSELHSAGLHTQILSMRNLRAGVYYFHISDGLSAKTVKILKN